MHIIPGPTINSISKLPNDYVFVDDHLGHDEEHGFEILCSLMKKTNSSRVIVDYADGTSNYTGITFLPVWVWAEAKQITDYNAPAPWTNKSKAFSFMSNKLRPSRQRMIELLVDNNLYTDAYSLVWSDSPFEEYPQKFFSHDKSVTMGSSIKNTSVGNEVIYEQFSKQNIFECSYVHLVTEPDPNSTATFLTEKSIFPFEAGNIPIWVGGWRHADYFSSLGFDVFDDIIDHGYQALTDPVQRLDQAILLNKNVLGNKDLLAEYFNTNRCRFEANRRLLRSGSIQEKYSNKIKDLALPKDLELFLLKDY